MRILVVLVAASSLVACSQGPGDSSDPTSSSASRLGGDAGLPGVPGLPGFDAAAPPLPSFDAGACAPTVTVSPSACSIVVGGTSCDCNDTACLEGAVTQCLGIDASVPSLPGVGGGGGPGFGACSQTAIDAARTQFCADVDAALSAKGIAFTLDCSTIGQPPTSITPPSNVPASGPACGDLTQAAAANAAHALSGCNPAAWVTWDPSARLQIFAAGDCMLP